MGFFLPRTVFQNFFYFSQWIWCSLSFSHTAPLQINPFSTFLDTSNSFSFRMQNPDFSLTYRSIAAITTFKDSGSHSFPSIFISIATLCQFPPLACQRGVSLVLDPFLITIEPNTCMFYVKVAVVLNEVLELFISGCIEFTCSSCCFQWATFQVCKFCFR